MKLVDAMERITDLAQQGILDDPEMSDERNRQSRHVNLFEDLTTNHWEELDERYGASFAELNAMTELPDLDMERIRNVAPGYLIGNAVALSLELAAQQYGEEGPDTKNPSDKHDPLDLFGAFWLKHGAEIVAAMKVVRVED